MNKKTLLIASLIGLGASTVAKADEVLIRELESLKKTLSPTDRTIPKLTTRLADLYFKEIVKNKNVKKNTKKAIRSYEKILNGFGGKFKKPQGEFNVAVQFNLARLYNRGTNQVKAMKFFESVLNDKYSAPKYKKESALSLAEYYENKNNFKKSQTYYSTSIELCQSGDTCAYNHFRLAWLYYREGQVAKAVEEIKPTLFDSKGQVNEQSFRDYKLFVSNLSTDGTQELADMEKLAERTSNPDLIREMGEAFFAAGNRKAGTYFIERVFQTDKKLYFRLRLLEEAIGFKNVSRIDELTEGIDPKNEKMPADEKKAKLTKEILKRVIVQIDAIRKNNVDELIPSLRKTIDLYLNQYPSDALREKMIDGYMDVVKDKAEKAEQLKRFADEEKELKLEKLEFAHRESRLGLLQKLKNSEELIAEALILAKMTKGDDSRKYTYVAAREYYAQKNNTEAQKIFRELYNAENLDKWAVQALNLDLDILNQAKSYSEIIATITPFEGMKSKFEKAGFGKDFKELGAIKKQAQFEYAVSLGQTPKALETFFEECFKGTFGEKACTNAKVLAVKLKDQTKLVKLLEKKKDEKALMNEYELMGLFTDAAKLQEKHTINKKSSINDILKLALLFELDGDNKNRDRLLKKVWKKLKRQKSIDEKYEPFYFLTFFEANMLTDSKVLELPWSEKIKNNFIVQLEYLNKGNKKTRRTVLKSKVQMGPTWSEHALAEVIKADKKQKKQQFYGRRSKYRVQKRVKLIGALKSTAEKYIEGANNETRVILASILHRAYADLEDEIKSTPLPEGLTPEILAQVEVQLKQMAEPFTNLKNDYQKLMDDQMTKITKQENTTYVKEVLAATYPAPVEAPAEVAEAKTEEAAPTAEGQAQDQVKTTQAAVKKPAKRPKAFEKYPEVDFRKFFTISPMEPEDAIKNVNMSLTQPMVMKLQTNPYDTEALTALKAFFDERKMKRQAKYFEDRIADAAENAKQAEESTKDGEKK
jgi:hypothetical protein